MPRKTNEAGVALIKSFEGLHDGDKRTPQLEPVLCPAGIWTIGWGHALVSGGRQLLAKDKDLAMAVYKLRYPAGMTKADADMLLILDLAEREHSVERLVRVPLTDNQFAALVSFVYNLGVNNFQSSTLLRKLNDRDYLGAAEQFLRWVNSNGVPLDGLRRRRAAERKLFLS